MNYCAVIVAAGASSRMGGQISKALLDLGGKTVIRRTLEIFENAKIIDGIVLVCRMEDTDKFRLEAAGLNKLIAIVCGGEDRQESVSAGVAAAGDCKYIVIHDGARPFVSEQKIFAVCQAAKTYGTATLAVKVKDTVKCANNENLVTHTPNRENLWQIQTPQVFLKELYCHALDKAVENGRTFTDDCQLVESVGGKVLLCPGDYDNIKLTTPEDMAIAKGILDEREGWKMRIGHGYDVHRLVVGRKLIIGGVEIPNELGLLGHSDADVLLHAVSDALLGAAGLGDIGGMFPDNDPAFKNADSLLLLKKVVEALKKRGCAVQNIDCTVIAQAPKLKPYIEKMRENIAVACEVATEFVNVKATTEEGLGFTGLKEGIAAHGVCIIN